MKSILILEDNADCRNWIADIVAETFPDADVVTVPLLKLALAEIQHRSFDLALIDLNLPDGEGQTLIRQIATSYPDTQTVVTTIMGSDSAVVSALSAGATGYLLKTESAAMVARHLRQLAHGVPALTPSIARRIMQHFKLTGPIDEASDHLTDRERETLVLIAQGLRASETATCLGIAESTVATYIKSIYRKLGIASRAEASYQATRMGLLDTVEVSKKVGR